MQSVQVTHSRAGEAVRETSSVIAHWKIIPKLKFMRRARGVYPPVLFMQKSSRLLRMPPPTLRDYAAMWRWRGVVESVSGCGRRVVRAYFTMTPEVLHICCIQLTYINVRKGAWDQYKRIWFERGLMTFPSRPRSAVAGSPVAASKIHTHQSARQAGGPLVFALVSTVRRRFVCQAGCQGSIGR